MNHYSATQLEEYCKSILVAAGVENSCAKAVAESLIDAELTGVSTHGVSRMAIYMERIEKGLVSKSMMQEIKGLRKADGFGEILIPGERSAKSLEARRKNGIDLPDQVLEELLSLGKPYGLSL